MDNIRRFEIDLDSTVYYPGQIIHGNVILDLVENLKIRKPSTLTNNFNGGMPILPQGQNKIPFKFALPNNFLPCSFESRFGNVRYFLRVILDIPFASPPQETIYFSVIGPPINCTDELYLSPVKLEKSKILWNMCGLRKGSFSLSTTLDRTAYCCGEFIKFRTEIHNKSHQYIVMSLQLKQHVEYRLDASAKIVDCVVTQKKTPKISPMAKVKISSMHFGLQVPIVPPTLNNVCRLIHINYSLKFCLELEKKNKDELHLEFPIIIGTIPKTFKNAPPPQLYYSYCVNHVEGGNYITPEFQTGQVYDGGFSRDSYGNRSVVNNSTNSSLEAEQIITAGGTSPSILYKPLYLTVVSPATKKITGKGIIANGSLDCKNVAEKGELNNIDTNLQDSKLKLQADAGGDAKILDYF